MKLLIVDDEIYVVRAIHNNLPWEELGITQVFMAFNVEKAKEIFRTEQIDILITDIEMPMESGMDLMRWVREQGYVCKAVCLTCHTEITFAQQALHLGMMEYVIKPVDFKKMEAIIMRAVNKIKDERLSREQQEQGVFWETNKQALETAFWEGLITGKFGEDPDAIIGEAEKRQIRYDFSSRYQLVLFVRRKICDRHQDWKENPELMKYIIYNIGLDILQSSDDFFKTGWIHKRMWVVLPERTATEMKEKLENFVDICSRITGAGIAAYFGESCFGEELPLMYRNLLNADKDNVSVESGIVDIAAGDGTSAYSGEWFKEIRRLIKENAWEGLQEAAASVWYSGRIVDKDTLYLEIEAAIYEIYRFLEHNQIEAADFWQRIPVQKTKEMRQSVECFAGWFRAAVPCMEELSRLLQEENEIIVKIKSFIAANIEEKISREQIADYVHFSTDYISKIFKHETGMSLSEYIMVEKMEFAKKLIESGDESIGEIAVKIGYNSFSYFSEIFKRLTGYSPSDYKRQCRG